MNALAAEIALRLECADVQTAPEHLSGTLNFTCDALSRLSEGAAMPAILAGIQRDHPRPRCKAFFWAWPRSLCSDKARTTPHACGPGDCVKGEGLTLRPLARPAAQRRLKEKVRAPRPQGNRDGDGAYQ